MSAAVDGAANSGAGGGTRQLSVEEVSKWFDSDGRLVKEAAMRKGLYEGGIHPSCRRLIFMFLFGIYPTNSTTSDQKAIDVENRANYIALRKRWEVLDKTITFPEDEIADNTPWYMSASEDECEEDDSNSLPPPHHSPLSSALEPTTVCRTCGKSCVLANGETGVGVRDCRSKVTRCADCAAKSGDRVASAERNRDDASSKGCGLCERACRKRFSTVGVLEDGSAMLQILEFPSKVFAARLPVDLEKSYPGAKRVILRDVARTDRNYHFFSHKRNLRKVHRILMIFALFHPGIGYAQGMNDILARFLVVTGSEIDSYFLFKKYMDDKRADFLEDTMMAKLDLVKNLVMEINSELYDFFQRSECSDYLFCHRWLLLDFKREFPLEDSIRIFEVLSTHYLELTSDKAMVETDKVIAEEFELDGGEMRANRSFVNLGFTFDLFVCVAILVMNSDAISVGTDAASVYGTLNSLSMKLDLAAVLKEAEKLFYKYCRLTVTRGFNEIQI